MTAVSKHNLQNEKLQACWWLHLVKVDEELLEADPVLVNDLFTLHNTVR